MKRYSTTLKDEIPNNVSNVKERNALKDKIQAKEVELAREKQVLSHEKKQSAGGIS